MFRPRKLQIGGEYEEDNKFNPTPINLRPQPSYGFVGPMQPTTPNYGPMGPFNYDNSPGLKDDCTESGMVWSEEDQRCVYPNGYDPTQEQEKNKPKGRGIDGMGTPKTGPGTGVNPQDPVKKQQSKIDPYFALRGATTGLSWLSEMVDRNRQNQYATDQYSTLGQIDPMPVSNFQPNRYNLYAQKGGKLSPITVDNPNDPRLRAYNDSSEARRITENTLLAAKWNKIDKLPVNVMTQDEYHKINPVADLSEANYKNIAAKIGVRQHKWGTQGFPIFPTPVQPVVYKKPVQPYIYKDEPQLKKSFNNYPLIDQESNELNIIPSNNPGQIAGDITPLPYRVEYDGTEHQNFLTEKEGTEFQNSLRNRPQGIPYGTRGYYEKKQKGGKLAPITVDNPNDPRLRAYNDSLNLYKAMQMQDKLMGPKSSISTTKVYPTEWTTKELKDRRNPKKVSGLDMPVAQDFKSEKDQFLDGFNLLWARKQDKQLLDYYKSLGFGQDRIQYHSSPDIVSDKIRPIGNYFDGTAESPIYKKPVQPVVYKKPKPEMYDLNGAPDDILKAYSDWKTGKGNVDEQVKLFRKYKVPETKYKGSPNFSFLEPFEQKDYPIVSRPGAQVRGTITPGQMTRDTTQDGVPIYGPANSTIGYWNNGEFSPYTGVNQRGTVNNPDTELMQNPEALKKYLRGKGLNFKKGGLTPNKARQILHDGTAQGHPLTDKQRRFFGAKSKGHTNFRK